MKKKKWWAVAMIGTSLSPGIPPFLTHLLFGSWDGAMQWTLSPEVTHPSLHPRLAQVLLRDLKVAGPGGSPAALTSHLEASNFLSSPV